MVRSLLLAVAVASFSLPGCQREAVNMKTLFDDFHEERSRLFPLEATAAGDDRYNDQLPIDIGEANRAEVKAFYSKYLTRLNSVNPQDLSGPDKISVEVLKWECELNVELLDYPVKLMPVNQFSSLPLVMGQLAGGQSVQPFKTVKDYDNWLCRLRSFAQWCDTAVVNMRAGIQQGWVLPDALTKKVIPQVDYVSKGPVEGHLYYRPVTLIPDTMNEGDKEKIAVAYSAMVGDTIIPAFRRMKDFLEHEYLAASRETSGIGAIPGGDKYYEFLIRYFTGTNMAADSIFELGQREVARIESEMEKVKQQVGFQGVLKDFFKYVRTNKKLMPFREPQEVIDYYNQIHNTMKPNLVKLFDKVPKSLFEVRRTEAFREKSASAEYNPGSLDGSRPGIFYVPVPEPRAYNIYSSEALFLHEAIPGHHYQISLQQEDMTLPRFRRTLYYSAFGEGWALYTESLGSELGLYTDPYQYFGMLDGEIHRAIRLVVDVGLHAKGWTREKAIQYSLDHEAASEDDIIAEIERYMAIPGQALSYKVGQLKIRELRKKAEQELGEKFDIRQFHNHILENGNIPLKVLENVIDKWIQDVKAESR